MTGNHKVLPYTQHALDVMKSLQENGWKMDRLVSITDKIMKEPLDSCSDDLDRKELKKTLFDAMEHYQGIGLSANQIGIKERAFIMYSDINMNQHHAVASILKKETITCFDPFITEYGEETIIMDEGCLTWPGLWLKVERPEFFRGNYYDVDGELVQVEMHGLEARIFQHEYDHMEGTNFTKRVSPLKLNIAKRRATKMMKKSLLSMK
jgi:peptide deformylase